MGFITEQQEGVTIIKIAHERLDSMIAPQLKSEILFLSNDGVDKILIDLSEVQYADSSGLGAFLFGVRQMKRIDGQLKLYAANEKIMNLVRIARLDNVLINYQNREEALRSFSSDHP
ncbi:MAG: STAS domain-containing protein [candidate division KSB1 bacterium]|nr:STAS domain-containing protein [candidate division KSB1 bacterium]MDZ7336022.1 STAS domain-containing protein [candidate division KSB1 bacterium]MDZ7358969.1 STAS domain-containing protein [candidate division KSB1 bacterium]MDZ7376202.1 STAS domain-containing protein [candidate division KSB1 bacterium]MDZ7401581.1 STAS domain-containing protein [candidate division KSB1 bacterium]